MPPRRSTTRRTAASTQHQSTLSFHGKSNKITKATSGRDITKAAATKLDSAQLDTLPPTTAIPTANPESLPDSLPDSRSATPAQSDVIPSPLSPNSPGTTTTTGTTTGTTTADVLGGIAPESDIGGSTAAGDETGWVGDEAAAARAIPETRIKGYWRRKEQERLAPRVHQEGLSVREKVLREWDMSGQYGPCIGIARLKRWKRANVLGLNPPMEVLAVLLKEMDEGAAASTQRAYVDELMTSHSVEA